MKKRGFSLIEISLVMAVIGLVIGGIIVAASSITETRKVNQSVEAIRTIVNNIKNVGVRKLVNETNIWKASFGLVPSELYNCKTAAFDYYGDWIPCTPWGGIIDMGIDLGNPPLQLIGVRWGNLDKSLCTRLARAVSVYGDLYMIRDYTNYVYIDGTGSNCQEGWNNITYYFRP